jgi:hypothetical protein
VTQRTQLASQAFGQHTIIEGAFDGKSVGHPGFFPCPQPSHRGAITAPIFSAVSLRGSPSDDLAGASPQGLFAGRL